MNLKKDLKQLLMIQGSLSQYGVYALYTVYAILGFVLWQTNVGVAIRPFGEVFSGLHTLWFEKGLAVDIGQSIQLNLTAIACSMAFTLIVCYAAIFPIFRPLAFVISKGRFLGLLGLQFIFITIFGTGFTLKVVLLTFGMSVFFTTTMYQIVTEIPEKRFDYARALGLSKVQILWHVLVRGTAYPMLEAFRQNAAIAWMMIAAVEGIVKAGGVGDILWDTNKHFDRGQVLAILFCILFIGIIQDVILKIIIRAVTPHIAKD